MLIRDKDGDANIQPDVIDDTGAFDTAAMRRRNFAKILLLYVAGAICFVAAYTLGYAGFVLCAFKRLTGYPCPGCGMTRAFAALMRLDVAAAVHYNLAALPLFICIVLVFIAAFLDAMRGTAWLGALRRIAGTRCFIACCALLTAVSWLRNIVNNI